jgi:hypothetical protein
MRRCVQGGGGGGVVAGEPDGELRRRVRERVGELGVAEAVPERVDRRAGVEPVRPAGVPLRRIGAHRHVRHWRLLQVILWVPCDRQLPSCTNCNPKSIEFIIMLQDLDVRDQIVPFVVQ